MWLVVGTKTNCVQAALNGGTKGKDSPGGSTSGAAKLKMYLLHSGDVYALSRRCVVLFQSISRVQMLRYKEQGVLWNPILESTGTLVLCFLTPA